MFPFNTQKISNEIKNLKTINKTIEDAVEDSIKILSIGTIDYIECIFFKDDRKMKDVVNYVNEKLEKNTNIIRKTNLSFGTIKNKVIGSIGGAIGTFGFFTNLLYNMSEEHLTPENVIKIVIHYFNDAVSSNKLAVDTCLKVGNIIYNEKDTIKKIAMLQRFFIVIGNDESFRKISNTILKNYNSYLTLREIADIDNIPPNILMNKVNSDHPLTMLEINTIKIISKTPIPNMILDIDSNTYIKHITKFIGDNTEKISEKIDQFNEDILPMYSITKKMQISNEANRFQAEVINCVDNIKTISSYDTDIAINSSLILTTIIIMILASLFIQSRKDVRNKRTRRINRFGSKKNRKCNSRNRRKSGNRRSGIKKGKRI